MGDLTDGWFEGRAHRRKGKNLKKQEDNLRREKELEDQKRRFVADVGAEHAEIVLGTSDATELETRIRSHLETLRVGDAAAGDDAAATEDAYLQQLDAESGLYQRNWNTLKSQAIQAQGRLLGILPRAAGYDNPAPTNQGVSWGPIVLATCVGIVEWLQTANWISGFLSVTQSSIGGGMRLTLALLISALVTAIVMVVTFMAGRKLKEGMVARHARVAEGVSTGGGSELGQGVLMTVLAVLFQTVTLGIRFATETSDKSAQATAIVLGTISFLGALAVLLYEYTSFSPPPSTARVVFTRHADAATVEKFQQAEYRIETGIPLVKRDLQIAILRREEKALQKLQAPAMEKGTAQMDRLNARIEEVRGEIAALYDKTFKYDPFDLEAAAHDYKQRMGL